MVAFLYWLFRIACAAVVLPVVARAVQAGQWLGACLLMAVLIVLCSLGDDGKR